MPEPLMQELAHHQYLRVQLVERFPDVDEETLADTVEGLTDLHEMLAAVLRSQQEDRVLAEALRARIGEMQERLSRIDHRAEKKRELVTTVMERARIDKILQPDLTVSMRQTPRPLVVTDESAIPGEFWRPQPAKLDRKGLIARLKEGLEIAGASLGNGGCTISVRVK